MRTVFAYAISANSDFALSGGTIASEHLRNITAMITSGSFFGIDVWMFAPDGSVNVHPPLVDMIVAGIGTIIKSVTGCSAETAAAAALGWSSAIVGALACIPMYYLGKEAFNGRKGAGFLAALFLAFCPVVISNTVFSNGTEIAFILFFTICMLYFITKGVKAIDNDHTLNMDFKSMFAANKTAMKYALYSAIMLIIIAYSWNGFRTLVILLLLVMLCVIIVNRLKVVDARPVTMFFSTIVLLGVAVAAPYYCLCGLWSLVFSGVVYATVFGLVVCILFAALQKQPWVYTIPAFIIAMVAVFVGLYFGAPQVYADMVYGNSVYAQDIQGIIGSTQLSLSAVATYFGYFTMWCSAIVVIYMAFKFLKNSNNVPFLVAFFALIIGMIFGVRSTAQAVVYSPFFAVGFAALGIWLFDTVSFSDYFKSFRGCNIKTIWRKIFSPKPFIAILCVILLVAAPNMMTAIDASVSNNEKSDWNQGAEDLIGMTFFGSMGYSVLTDDDYKTNYTLKQYGSQTEYEGKTVLSWIDYSADIVTYGHMKSVTDTRGNNGVAMAQILLGDETKGEATAAMIIYSMEHMGLKEGAKWLSENNYITVAERDRIYELADHPSEYKNYVLRAQSVYGQLQSNISDENVVYIYLKKYLTEGIGAGVDVLKLDDITKSGYTGDSEFKGIGHSSWELSRMYSAIAEKANTKIDFVMATINMIPIQIGDGSVFESIAHIAGYASSHTTISNSKFSYVPTFYTINTSSYAYNYTTEMYNSLLYKTIGGKTTAEATQSYDSSVFESAYGLSNFNPDYANFYVKYNKDSDATSSSDGWKTITYNDALKEKRQNGGVINYYGYPIMVEVVDYSSTPKITGFVRSENGTVTPSDLENARVELWSSDGHKLATAYTNRVGYYEVPIVYDNCTIKMYAGAASTATTGGSLVYTKLVNKDTKDLVSHTIDKTTFTGYVDFKDKDITNKMVSANLPDHVKVTITGTNYKKVYEAKSVTVDKGNGRINFVFDQFLVIDTYSIKVETSDGTSLGTGTYTLSQGDNNGFSITGTICEETITVVDDNSVPVNEAVVTLTNDKSGIKCEFKGTNMLGKTSTTQDGSKIYLAPGTYTVKVTNSSGVEYLISSGTITVSSATSTHTVTITKASCKITLTGLDGFTGDEIYITNGTYSAVAKRSDGFVINVPVSSLDGDRASAYTAYAYQEQGKKVFFAKFTAPSAAEQKITMNSVAAVKVTGKITKVVDNSDPAASAGTVYFNSDSMFLIAEAIKFDNTSDYVYTAYLPAGVEWKMCTTDGSSYVTYETQRFDADTSKDITMGKGYSISGKFYWGTNQYFKLVKMHVSGIQDVPEFDVPTDTTGSFSVMIPEGKTCKVTTPALTGTKFYFNDQKNQDAQSYDFSTDKKSNNFVAYANNTKGKYTESDTTTYNYVVKNSTPYTIYLGSDEVKSGEVKKYTSPLTQPYISVLLKYVLIDNSYYYASLNVAIEEIKETTEAQCAVYEIKDVGDVKSYAEKYQEVKVKYTGDKVPTVTITNVRSSDLVNTGTTGDKNIQKPFTNLTIKDGTNVTTGDNRYVQKFISYNDVSKECEVTETTTTQLTNPYLVKITRTVTEKVEEKDTSVNKIFYSTMLGNVNYEFNADTQLTKSVSYTGTTGSTYSGNLTFNWKDSNEVAHVMATSISSGSYSISLPAEQSYFDVVAKVTSTVNETTYQYDSDTKTISVPKDKDSVTFNIPVSSKSLKASDSNDPYVEIAIEGMSDPSNAEDPYTKEHKQSVTFTATLKNAVDKKTYLLSGGSVWSSIKFYDIKTSEEISSITADGTAVRVRCVGVFDLNYVIDEKTTTSATAAADSSNLTVIFSETNGTVVARGGFYSSGEVATGWKSTNLPIEIGFGTNIYGQGASTFAVKVVNPNNVPVKFTLTINPNINNDDDTVYLVHCGNDLFTLSEPSLSTEIVIPGATTTEVQIEKISISGATDTSKKMEINLAEIGSFTLKRIGDSEKIVIDNDKKTAKVTCDFDTDGQIDVKDHDASGRGVFNVLASTPVYVMVLGALVLLAVIAMLWLGFRRGVFSRKK